MVPTILVIVVIVAVGVGVLAYRNRSEKGIESGITSFRRELHALAPRTRPDDDPREAVAEPVGEDPADEDPADEDAPAASTDAGDASGDDTTGPDGDDD